MHFTSTIRRVVGTLIAAVAAVVVLAPTALAHDPIFLSDDQTTPDVGPYMPDGTISWALYGQVLDAGDTRGFEFDLRDGDELFVGLLIPNLAPEVDLGDEELPVLMIERPDGTMLDIVPEERTVFDEPFSKTSYVNLVEVREPGQAGRYRGVVTGNAPARFSVAIGETEIFFTETERSGERPSSFLEITEPLQAWYTTPPGGEPSGELVDGEAEIDLDLIEDAMDSGVGSVADGVDEDAAMAEAEPAGSDETAAADDDTAEAESATSAAADGDTDAAAEPDSSATSAVDDAEEVAQAVSAADAGDGDDGGGGSTWVAPAVIAAIAVIGAGAWFAGRGRDKATA